MGRKVKINNGIDIGNAKKISMDGFEITFEHINALFLSERCGYTVVNTPCRTKVILTPPTYNEADKHMIDQQQEPKTYGDCAVG